MRAKHRVLWSLLLSVACLAPIQPSHAALDASVTAGPVMDAFVYSFTPDQGNCQSNIATVLFTVELAAGSGAIQVTSACGVFHIVFEPGECALRAPPLSGVVCEFTGSDGTYLFAATNSRLPIRHLDAVAYNPSGGAWDLGGSSFGLT